MVNSSQSNKLKKNESSKKIKVDWFQCQECSVRILDSNKLKHEEDICAKMKIDSDTIDEPFLSKNYAKLTLVEHSRDLNLDIGFKKEYIFDYALINPYTMKLLGLKLGDLILVRNSTSFIPVVCWPFGNIEIWQVALSKSLMSLNGIFQSSDLEINAKIYKLDRTKSGQAKKVILKVVSQPNIILNDFETQENASDEDTVHKNESFIILGLFKEMYLNKFVIENQQVFVVYMGKKLIFEIVKILKSSSEKVQKKKDLGVAEISEKLNNSTLNDSERIETIDLGNFLERGIDSEFYQISQLTQIEFVSDSTIEMQQDTRIDDCKIAEENYLLENLAGLNKEIELLKEIFYNPIDFVDLYQKIGVKHAKGVLLFGPNGCGKTTLAKAVCNEFKYAFVELKIADIFSRNFTETESKLRKIFKLAWSQAPSIIFVDDIDKLCPRKETNSGQETERKVLNLFASLIDTAKAKNVSLLCTTSKIDAVDLSLRTPGRLDKEIEISIPNQTARYQILSKKLKCMKSEVTELDIQEVAQNCHGYVGSDIELLAQEAGLCCLKRLLKLKSRTSDCDDEILGDSINKEDLFQALKIIKPSAMKEITFDIPKVYWDHIGGQHDLKKKLQQAIIWPIKHADAFKRLNIRAPRGILMYGPPGCSKTMIAKALATETGLNFIAVKGPELFSKWVGESERMVREIFRKARSAAPSIIFFDEIDAVAMERSSSSNKGNNVGDRVLAQLLNEMDGVENLIDVTIVAATNRPDMIDKALMRPGRLDRIVYVRLPDEEARREIFELKFKQIPVEENIDIQLLVNKTERFSGAEIAALCNEAAFMALDGNMQATHIKMEHFELAFSIVVPRTSDSTIDYFDNFSCDSGFLEI